MLNLIWMIVFLKYQISFTESLKVARITQSSKITFVDLWNSWNKTFNTNDYLRTKPIDEWQDRTPIRVTIGFYDVFRRQLAAITFNSSGSQMDLLSWMTNNRFAYSYPYRVRPYFGMTGISNSTLYITEIGSEDKYLFVTGADYSGLGNQMILYSKNGSGFSLIEENFQTERKVFWQSQFTNDSFEETNSTINFLTHFGSYRFINGIAVLNEDNQSVVYNMGYNSIPNKECNSSFQTNLSDIYYTFNCNGSINELPDIRIACLWLYFSEAVYNFTVTLTESDRSYISAYEMRVWNRYEEESATTSPEVTTETCSCPCTKSQNIYANKTTEELELLLTEITSKLKKELSVDVGRLSSSIRKKTSASDTRPSAAGVGVLGIVLLVSLITSLLISDLGRLYSAMKELYNELCHKQRF